MSNSFDRIVRADRPLTTTLALIGIGFALSLMAGIVIGLSAEHFRSAFGQTVAVGMLATAVTIIALLATAAVRQKK